MRVTLACRLKDAVGDVKQFKDGNVDPQKFIDWCDKYQVSYATLLTASANSVTVAENLAKENLITLFSVDTLMRLS